MGRHSHRRLAKIVRKKMRRSPEGEGTGEGPRPSRGLPEIQAKDKSLGEAMDAFFQPTEPQHDDGITGPPDGLAIDAAEEPPSGAPGYPPPAVKLRTSAGERLSGASSGREQSAGASPGREQSAGASSGREQSAGASSAGEKSPAGQAALHEHQASPGQQAPAQGAAADQQVPAQGASTGQQALPQQEAPAGQTVQQGGVQSEKEKVDQAARLMQHYEDLMVELQENLMSLRQIIDEGEMLAKQMEMLMSSGDFSSHNRSS